MRRVFLACLRRGIPSCFARELPRRQREVLILRYQRDLDDESIGEILGLSASGVRSLVARACETLRRNPEIWR